MEKERLLTLMQHNDQEQEKTIRLIEAFTDKEMSLRYSDIEPSVQEVIYDIYIIQRTWAEGARDGKVKEEENNVGALALDTVQAAKNYARSCHQMSNGILLSMSEDELQQEVEIPGGSKWPAWKCFVHSYIAHWQRRYKLYQYLWILRKEPESI